MPIFLTLDDAEKRLLAAGMKPKNIESILRALDVKKEISENDLREIENSLKILGEKNLENFLAIVYKSTAFNQLSRRFTELGILTDRAKKLFVLKSFQEGLSHIINNPRLRGSNFTIALQEHGDHPFKFSVTIFRNPKGGVGTFSFDLLFSRTAQPRVVLGNMQGHIKENVDEFKKVFGKAPLNFMIESFQNVFKEPGQLIATNVKYHNYRRLADKYVSHSMLDRKKLSIEEFRLFTSYSNGDVPANSAKEVIAKVEGEKSRIIREGTGMHKAAYKKAGFKITKSRFWRRHS